MSPPFPGRLIHAGESGDDVRAWQERMKERGWRINVTGVHDEQSVAVCSAFQIEKGLGLDGLIGEETWEGAFNLPVTPGPSRGAGTHSVHKDIKVKLYVNRTTDDIEIGAVITNIGDVPIPAHTLTITVRVVNPLASPNGAECEVTRFETPVIEALGVGKEIYQMFYDVVPLRRDPFQAEAWVQRRDDVRQRLHLVPMSW